MTLDAPEPPIRVLLADPHALFRRGVVLGFYPLERVLYLLLWLIPTGGMILNRLDLPVMPLIVLLFGAIAWARLVTVPKVELPSAATAR